MIYTLTFNPSLDYIVTVPKFTCGVVNRTTEEIIFPGGKGINVSMVLKNLGFENTALGFYAGFTGMELKRLVADKGIHAEFIPVDKGSSGQSRRARLTDRGRRSLLLILINYMKSWMHWRMATYLSWREVFRM